MTNMSLPRAGILYFPHHEMSDQVCLFLSPTIGTPTSNTHSNYLDLILMMMIRAGLIYLKYLCEILLVGYR